MPVSPYVIDVPQESLDDLRARLRNTRWPDEIEGAAWEYGTNLAFLQDIVAYWRDGFDWREQERRLNRLAHVRAEIDGIGVHLIHERGTGPNPVPLLMLHGWPSSFVQMLDILPMLTDPERHGGDISPSFDVIVASLPGYGFSNRPKVPGMSAARIAGLFHTLMTDVLGYPRYGLRGSDLGAGVTGQMALAHPEAVIGHHTGGTNPWVQDVPDDLTEEEQEFVANAQMWSQTEMAYAMEHSSKPQTLAYGLNDSPAGMASWILEKFHRWSDCNGDLTSRFARDDLLTNLTIYWATETIGSSIRLYYETIRDPGDWGRADVPTAMLMPRNDMFPTPRSWVERTSRVDRWTETDRGGHFLEWEEPALVAGDLRAFFGPLLA
jgi:pimeloyl-ACP methyl ester carboxylesterase